nr:immunoglobulin heavy chain junction region [Mus musculus]MBK4195741.1 immunoglobulin heavy chain junction region [Mus musculus]
CARERLFDFW